MAMCLLRMSGCVEKRMSDKVPPSGGILNFGKTHCQEIVMMI